MRSVIRTPFGLALVLGIFALFPVPTRADDFRLESVTLPIPLLENGKVNTVIEASGVEPIGDGSRFLVAHDKHPALFVVETASGKIMGPPLTSPRFPQLNGAGPKWEGMARDSEGNYYLIGAHKGKTDQEKLTKSVLIRFRLKDDKTTEIDDASVVFWHVAQSLASGLKSLGLPAEAVDARKVEGLSIRESKTAAGATHRQLLIGLREPKDKVRAFVADITSTPSPDAELELAPLFAFTADQREGNPSELTSLEYVPALGGCLVVTASEDKSNAFHGNTLWFVADGQTASAVKIATFEVAMKCEGLAILGSEKGDGKTSIKLLFTFDNDAHTTHIPSRFQTATLVWTSH